jgi:hypothetical protein
MMTRSSKTKSTVKISRVERVMSRATVGSLFATRIGISYENKRENDKIPSINMLAIRLFNFMSFYIPKPIILMIMRHVITVPKRSKTLNIYGTPSITDTSVKIKCHPL